MRKPDPLGEILATRGLVFLDGGLATELESLGCDLDDPLWSATALLERPEAVSEVHRRYLEAGADVIATVTYQATFPGLRRRGLSDVEIERVLGAAVELATAERDAFSELLTAARPAAGKWPGRARPLVAASIGPYGAYLADGSEYRGDYAIGRGDLYDFHAPRWEVLAATPADLLACETTPSAEETAVYCRLAAVSGRPTWVSFQCRDAAHIADGTPLAEVAAMCDEEPNVVAVGVNCTPPALVGPLIDAARRVTEKPILVYPNAGEGWDADSKRWTGARSRIDWAERAVEWARRGAAGIGGCCRTGPGEIAAIRAALDRTAG